VHNIHAKCTCGHLSVVYSSVVVRVDISPVRSYERSGRSWYRQRTWSVLVKDTGAERDPTVCVYLKITRYVRPTGRIRIAIGLKQSGFATRVQPCRLKVGFHYPSSRPELTGVKKCTRVHGPSTRPVNSGRELG